MDIRAQVSMVFHLDKCIGCHTCSVACKNIWTDREGVEYQWWNNVETKPGTGYPTLWENQDEYKGGWEAEDGRLQLKLQSKVGTLGNIFYNRRLPTVNDYYEPWTYDYEHLFNAPEGDDQPTARPISLITGEFMEIESGPNWDDDLGGSPVYASNDPNVGSLTDEERVQLNEIERVAPTNLAVLISGETGVGKDVAAREIHRQSGREGDFVAVNCAAIPESMLEATLFGHEKGAFTGAYQSAPGKFEQANGGTLLLDEVSEMDLSLQAKLLRVLQEREVERVGGRAALALDVRVIATSNRDLAAEVAAGRFREDLFYRLSVFPMHWPALRQRAEDIIPLAQCFLLQHAAKMGRSPAQLSAAAAQQLSRHRWPGNVRELDNIIQRALILQPGDNIEVGDLLFDTVGRPAAGDLSPAVPAAASNQEPATIEAVLGEDLKQREYEIIVEALRETQGSKKDAALKLGVSPRTLRYKLARMRQQGIAV